MARRMITSPIQFDFYYHFIYSFWNSLTMCVYVSSMWISIAWVDDYSCDVPKQHKFVLTTFLLLYITFGWMCTLHWYGARYTDLHWSYSDRVFDYVFTHVLFWLVLLDLRIFTCCGLVVGHLITSITSSKPNAIRCNSFGWTTTWNSSFSVIILLLLPFSYPFPLHCR